MFKATLMHCSHGDQKYVHRCIDLVAYHTVSEFFTTFSVAILTQLPDQIKIISAINGVTLREVVHQVMEQTYLS